MMHTGHIDKKSLMAWVGGKRLLRPVIEKFIPAAITSYCEPFGGAGWVLFYKERWADLEIYNDLDSRLVNLFRVVKYHPDALQQEMSYLLASREMFETYIHSLPVTDIQKAARFLFVINFSFGARGESFATTKKGCRGVKSTLNVVEKISYISRRLDKVLIENKDFEVLLDEYDHKEAFFYCDPPYTTGAGYEVTSCEKFDHNRLKNCLKKIKGRFLLSYNNCEQVKNLYKGFNQFEFERQTGINNKSAKNTRFKELLITNYDMDICEYKVTA